MSTELQREGHDLEIVPVVDLQVGVDQVGFHDAAHGGFRGPEHVDCAGQPQARRNGEGHLVAVRELPHPRELEPHAGEVVLAVRGAQDVLQAVDVLAALDPGLDEVRGVVVVEQRDVEARQPVLVVPHGRVQDPGGRGPVLVDDPSFHPDP
jgi:hypothetical protein